MPSEPWGEVREIFEAALELTGKERVEFLDRACEGKPEFRAEVASLLDADLHAGEFLDHSPVKTWSDIPGLMAGRKVIGHCIGPYQITKAIGEGGMAVVYEAVRVDGQFNHRVAVKMVKPGLIPDTAAARFRAERQILADLRHPSIAQLLDGGVSDGIPYFVLELVEGKHINEYCSQSRLSIEQRLVLFKQVCDAVQYAHSKGIVHRDIKPNNILVGDAGIPKLLDFGIAKILRDGPEQAVTRTVDRMATPNYASPEQLAGDPITVGSDIYSLGILLYELISGTPPSSTKVLAADQQAERPSVAARNSGIPVPARLSKALDRVVMKAIHRDPARRYLTVRELSIDVQRLLEGKLVYARGDGAVYTLKRFARRQPMFLTGILALALGVAVLAGALWNIKKTAGSAGRKSVAVLGFQNLSGKPASDWLSTALSEMFTTELASTPKLLVISGDRVARAKRDLAITALDAGSSVQLARLRQNLDAQYILTGSYLAGGENSQSLELYVRLQDTKSGETLIASTGNGFENELPGVVFRSALKIQRQLGIDVSAKQPSVAYAIDPRAVPLYAHALSEQRKGNAKAARKSFEDALSIEPNSPLIRSSYASTLSVLGYDQRALQEAKLSLDHSSGLPREQRILLEGRYHEYAAQWKEAVENYRTLWNLFYDNVDYGILLAHAQNRAGLPDEALKTIKTQTLEGAAADPRAIMEEANAYLYRADFAAVEAAALRARERAEKLGARTWVADTYSIQGAALNSENKYAEAIQAYATAQRLYTALNDDFGSATASRGIGIANSEQGNYTLAEEYYSIALSTFSRLGFRRGEAATLSNLSLVKKSQSDFPGALKLMEQSIAVQEDIGDKLSLSHSLLNYGSTLRKLNFLQQAKEAFTKSLQLARDVGDPEQIVRVLVMLGDTELDAGELAAGFAQEQEALDLHSRANASPRVHALVLQHVARAKQYMGKLGEAKADYEASLEIGRKRNLKQFVSDNLVMLSEVDREQGDLDGSDRLLGEAEAIYRKEHQRGGLLDVQLSRAKNDLAANRLDGLGERLQQCVAGYHDLGLSADGSDASVTLAEYWLRRSSPSQSIAALRALKIPTFALRTRAGIAAARVASTQGRARESAWRLKALGSNLAAKKWIGLSLEARLASAEAELNFDKTAARYDVAALKRETAVRGFVLLALAASQLH